MKAFEFVLIILSLIVGLSLTEAAIGISYMIQNYRVANFYLPFIAMATTGFLYILNYYSSLFKLRRVAHWNVARIGVVFLTGLVYFTLTQIYFPDQDNFDQDYERYFNENFQIVLTLMISFIISFMLELYIVRQVRKLKAYMLAIVIGLTILTGVVITNKEYWAVLTIILLALQIFNIYWSKLIIKDDD